MDLLQPYYGILLTILAVLAAIIVIFLGLRMFNRRVRGRRRRGAPPGRRGSC